MRSRTSELQYMLEVDGLVVGIESTKGTSFPIDHLDLRVRYGEIHGLTGLSGVGKSMTALAVLGLVQPRPGIVQGAIRYKGENLLAGIMSVCSLDRDEDGKPVVEKRYPMWNALIEPRFAERRGRGICLITQEPRSSLDPVYRVEAQIGELIGAALSDKSKIRTAAAEALRRAGLRDPEGFLSKYLHEMSGGECQRVSIALALLSGADLIIADEPTSSVDPVTKRDILRALRELTVSSGKAVILISHNLDLITDYCDSYTVMLGGKDVEYAAKAQGSGGASIRHPYTRELKMLVDTVVKGDGVWDALRRDPGEGGNIGGPRCGFYYLCGLRKRRKDIAKKCYGLEAPRVPTRGECYVRCWGYEDATQ